MKAIQIFSLVLVGALLLAGVAVVLPLLNDDTVTVAFSEKSNFETLIIAKETGMLEEAGIKPLVVTGGIRAAEALVTGSADMAAMGDGPAISTISKDNGAMIVARFINGEGMHRFIAHTDILEPKDLEGKKVGLQQGSSTHGAFLRWMDANGVDSSKVILVPMDPINIPLAMQSGVSGQDQNGIVAMVGSEPWAIATERLCGSAVHEIGNSSGQGTTFPMVLLASQRIMERNPAAVSAMIEILMRSNQFIIDNWSEAMDICASRTGVADAAEQEMCSLLQNYEVGFNGSDLQSLEMAAEVMLEFGRISSLPDIPSRIDLRFLTGLDT